MLWVPALFFWIALVGGMPLDLRTEEEIQEDEYEVKRLERYFDVEGLDEASYLSEWTAKEEALSNMMEKLLRSPRFMDILARGPSESNGAPEVGAGFPPGDVAALAASTPWLHAPARKGTAAVAAEAEAVEVSYVLPPPQEDAVGPGSLVGSSRLPWEPRLIVAHRGGGLALVSLAFEHVDRDRNREPRWACTFLKAELIAKGHGESAQELICDLSGPVPHGVRYMRV